MRKSTFIVTGIVSACFVSGSGRAQPPGSLADMLPMPPISTLRSTSTPASFLLNEGSVRRWHGTPASWSDVRVGTILRDNGHRYIGRVASVDSTSALIRYDGDKTAAVPLRDLWKVGNSLAVQLSRTQFERGARHR